MENIVMHNLKWAISALLLRFPDSCLSCIETGTIRSHAEKHNSTLHISESLDTRGVLTSVDINPGSICISKDVCSKCSNITWVQSDSLAYLKKQTNKFHFAFLDSVNNRDHIFEEFKLVVPQMIPGGIIIVDDAGVTPTGEPLVGVLPEKGRKVSKFLLSLGCKDFVRSSAHGTQLWIDMETSLIEKMQAKLAVS